MKFSKHSISAPLQKQLANHVYDIIACIHFVYRDLGNGLPESIYQEALAKYLIFKGFNVKKEYQHHPIFMDERLDSYIKIDIVVILPKGNVIIECKAISKISNREQFQTFGYLRGTNFPIALLVNFGAYPNAEIQRYYYKDDLLYVF